MRTMGLVIKHEIRTTLGKRSFWLTTFLFPLIIIAFTALPQAMAERSLASSQQVAAAGPDGKARAVGYVDEAGIIAQLPPSLAQGEQPLRAFATRSAAQAALAAGELRHYVIIPSDFITHGQLVQVDEQFAPLGSLGDSDLLTYIITYNLVGDEDLAWLLIDPTPAVESQSLAPATREARNAASPFNFFVPFSIMFILFFTITLSSGFMLQSVVKEKENRTAEVLLLSLRPVDLMAGKVLGLGVVALLQMAIWTGGGMLVMQRGQGALAAGQSFALPPGFMVWTVLYFLLGYLVYSSALGALGALAPNLREGSQFTFIILLPLMIPLWLNSVFLQSPNSALATFLSLFPLTAPSSMITRLAVGDVPAWQPVAGLLGLAVTAYLFVRLAARFFRADNLLSSGSLGWQRLASELRRAIQ